MNITIIGAGKSGLSAAILAQRDGDKPFLTESAAADTYSSAQQQLSDAGIEHEFGNHSAKALSNCDLIITSPGVPPYSPIIVEAESRGIPIISELEYAASHVRNPIISITGTNGKTTTTALTAYLLSNAGKPAIAAGNIGTPLSACLQELDPATILVIEASSYQLDRIKDYKPKVGIILNITPDHLTYHRSFEAYERAKWKTSLNQDENDIVILNADSPSAAACAKISRANIQYISMNPVQRGAYARDNQLIFVTSEHNEEVLMPFNDVRLPGVHNRYNSMAAALAARAFEIRNENIRDGLMQFSGVEHRLEFVRIRNNVQFINDSKATNINAAWYALSSYQDPIIWIAGGRGDNNTYNELDSVTSKHVKTIIAIGEEQEAIFNHFCTSIRCLKAESLEEATQLASQEAIEGDIVLFSPACKSFDMFANFEHRGQVFKSAVQALL
ncbi:MAG: UDP-N-acetylmuramoyl-L-alanine--D-glutamate ligase [Ignavibacteria bacterium]